MNEHEAAVVRTSPTLTENEVYQLIGNSRRRAVVNIMLSENQSLALSELARRTAQVESERDGSDPSDIYKSVYVSLQQNHLPKLDERGVVNYDAEMGTIEPGPHLYRFGPYVRWSGPASTLRTLLAIDPKLAVVLVTLGVVLGFLVALLAGVVP